ncbi:MAG: type II toxin-antitoxin system VapC family toxin [Terracidiphilus sp.]|nr:type II toxin-antitoxin system VapC family toxin [Terracidiphilus sp.]
MIYLDASIVFSLYCADRNSVYATSLIAAARAPLILSSLCEFEVVNAFSLCIFRKEIAEHEALGARRKLDMNIESGAYRLRPLPESAFTRAKALTQKITPSIEVRAADLLHIAAALELGANSLYTLDQKQHQAAQAAGLTVNPLPSP